MTFDTETLKRQVVFNPIKNRAVNTKPRKEVSNYDVVIDGI